MRLAARREGKASAGPRRRTWPGGDKPQNSQDTAPILSTPGVTPLLRANHTAVHAKTQDNTLWYCHLPPSSGGPPGGCRLSARRKIPAPAARPSLQGRGCRLEDEVAWPGRGAAVAGASAVHDRLACIQGSGIGCWTLPTSAEPAGGGQRRQRGVDPGPQGGNVGNAVCGAGGGLWQAVGVYDSPAVAQAGSAERCGKSRGHRDLVTRGAGHGPDHE